MIGVNQKVSLFPKWICHQELHCQYSLLYCQILSEWTWGVSRQRMLFARLWSSPVQYSLSQDELALQNCWVTLASWPITRDPGIVVHQLLGNVCCPCLVFTGFPPVSQKDLLFNFQGPLAGNARFILESPAEKASGFFFCPSIFFPFKSLMNNNFLATNQGSELFVFIYCIFVTYS